MSQPKNKPIGSDMDYDPIPERRAKFLRRLRFALPPKPRKLYWAGIGRAIFEFRAIADYDQINDVFRVLVTLQSTPVAQAPEWMGLRRSFCINPVSCVTEAQQLNTLHKVRVAIRSDLDNIHRKFGFTQHKTGGKQRLP